MGVSSDFYQCFDLKIKGPFSSWEILLLDGQKIFASSEPASLRWQWDGLCFSRGEHFRGGSHKEIEIGVSWTFPCVGPVGDLLSMVL